ncbi:MAG: hypothetical protein CME64_17455 [Halobacteriovoraceae bacterium]|nr:hypothetical protein [Halobacteriovoraceae bacterium]|tara:strand:- start:329341 stop:330168 length:828 start_codon:yes stop_codon:yes gene_type:complete
MIKALVQRAKEKETPYILPTMPGLIFIGVFFTLFLMGLVYGNNLTLLLAFCMFAFLLGVMFKTHDLVKRYTSIDVRFDDSYLPQAKTNLQGPFSMELQTDKGTIEGHSSTGSFSLKGLRGRYKVNTIKLHTSGDWGLFRVWRYVKVNKELYIYPRPLAVEQDFFKEISQEGAEIFNQHKRYERGHPSKRIDWKVFAKKDELLIKEFNENRPESFEINDIRFKGDFEETLSKMAWLVNKAHLEGLKWELSLKSGAYLRPGKGHSHFKRSMEILSEA